MKMDSAMAACSSLPISVPSSSSSSFSPRLYEYEVFLNFRGEDTRKGFTKHLYNALKDAGVHTFMDDEQMEAGEMISERLKKAIEESKCYVAVISNGYADSKWCLMELAAMFHQNKEIIPVFYYVDPSDVRHQTGPFEKAFCNYKQHFSPADVEKWIEAMASVGGFKGFVIDEKASEDEAQVIRKIVERVGGCSYDPLPVTDCLVGIDSRVEDVIKLLSIEEGGVKMMGIYGMGGVGKTTLAKAIHNKLQGKFKKIVYIEGVKEKKDRLPELQEEFISKAFKHGCSKIYNVSEGITQIETRCRSTSLLAILDDVDHRNQLEALAGKHGWFGEGSRILITTRDMKLLDEHRVDQKYQVDELNHSQSLHLFSWHAFNADEPSHEYMKVSQEIVIAAAGLPLALVVLGSSLFGNNNKRIWQEVVEKLRGPDSYDGINKCLSISYDGLQPKEKDMFKDIACFFIGTQKSRVVDLLKGCDYRALESTLDALLRKCLLKVDEIGELDMHDLIRDMGRRFGSHSRLLVDQHQVWDVLDRHQGTPDIKGIVCQKIAEPVTWVTYPRLALPMIPKQERESLDVEVFNNMSKLRILVLENVDLTGEFSKMPSRSLRSLQWRCSMKKLPDDFNLQQIGFLDLSNSSIVQLWSDSYISKKKVRFSKSCIYSAINWFCITDGKFLSYKNRIWCFDWQLFTNLRVLHLNGCKELVGLPDFSLFPKLEKLNLEGCIKLESIPDSIFALTKLIYLNISECKLIKELPHAIGDLQNLIELYLEGTDIDELPRSVWSLQTLQSLTINGYDRKKMPRIVATSSRILLDLARKLRNLTILRQLDKMTMLGKGNPTWAFDMNLLEESQVSGALRKLPNSLCTLSSLCLLQLSDSNIEELPESIGFQQNLRIFRLTGCGKLKFLPESIGNLTRLEALGLSCCHSLKVLPNSIGNLNKLRILTLELVAIEDLPYTIQSLENIESLTILKCNDLRTMPSLFELRSLKELKVSSWASLTDGHKDAYNLVKMSGRSPHTQEFRSLHFLCPLTFELDLWELTIAIGGQERVIELVEYHSDHCNGRQWLNLIFPDDFVDVQCTNEDWSPGLGGSTSSGHHNLDCIRELDLSDCDMEELDESIGDLTNLKDLNLSSCKNLKCLPNSLGRLTGLRSLCLRDCESLAALPDSIGCLVNLNLLNLIDSGIKGLPDTIRLLCRLQMLLINGCIELRGGLPLHDWKWLRALVVGVGLAPRSNIGEQRSVEQVPDYMFEMSGHSQQLQQTRRLRFIGFDDDEEILRDVWELSITTMSGEEMAIVVTELVTFASENKWQWVGSIFPEDFDRKYVVATSSDKTTLLDTVEKCHVDVYPFPPPPKIRPNWNRRREGCGSLLARLMIEGETSEAVAGASSVSDERLTQRKWWCSCWSCVDWISFSW